MQRLGFLRRALVVAPAHLVSKWQADFERFFGGGLRAITAQTVREHALETDHDLWIVSLDLLAVNPAVQAAIHPDRMGGDAVVFDEAHRLTPTAVSYYQAGRLLALNTPRALLMTATPHRGKEWLFRALLHLVDPDVYPPVTATRNRSRSETGSRALPAAYEGRPRRLRWGDQAVQGPEADERDSAAEPDRGGLLRRSSRPGRPVLPCERRPARPHGLRQTRGVEPVRTRRDAQAPPRRDGHRDALGRGDRG